jgi:CheY-like chemotaxis protein
MAAPSESSDSFSPSVSSFSLNSLLDETFKPLRAKLEPHVSVEIRQSSRIPPVRGESGEIRRLLVDLWSRALQAVGAKPGMITIMTHAMRLDAAALLTLRFAEQAKPGEFVVFEIDDTGAGMDLETVAETLSPLPTAIHESRRAGLDAIAPVIRAYGGALYVESEPGHGVTVQVFLPAASSTRAPAFSGDAENPNAITVLIADDDDAIRALAKWVVERAGFKTLTARNGFEALAHFQEHPDAVHLVLLDLSMPRMTGEEAITGLRAIRPDIPIVLITGHGEDAILKSEKDGVVAILQKPFTPDDLRRVLLAHARR